MSWPALELNTKATDFSSWNNLKFGKPDHDDGRIDFFEFASENPEIRVIVSRACATYYVDRDFEHNYDESERAGFLAASYVNNNPAWTIADLLEMWKRAHGGRSPKLIIYDCETARERSPTQVTNNVRGGLDALRGEWPDATIWIYTGAYWWNPNILHGWEAGEAFMLAHYPYVVQVSGSDWRVADSFEEMDRRLPIDNNFTPRTPRGVLKVGAWQFTSSGDLEGIADKTIDLNYFLTADINAVYDGGELPPEDDPDELIPITIEVPAAKISVKVREV